MKSSYFFSLLFLAISSYANQTVPKHECFIVTRSGFWGAPSAEVYVDDKLLDKFTARAGAGNYMAALRYKIQLVTSGYCSDGEDVRM